MEHHCCHDQGQEASHTCCGQHNQEASGCGHGCCGGCGTQEIEVVLNRKQADFLRRFALIPFLPLVRFLARSSTTDHLETVTLSAVFLETGSESLEEVKATGALLEALEEKGLITLDYDIPLTNYDYSLFDNSAVYARFREVIAEGAGRPGFLIDTPAMEQGSMALTELGTSVLEQI